MLSKHIKIHSDATLKEIIEATGVSIQCWGFVERQKQGKESSGDGGEIPPALKPGAGSMLCGLCKGGGGFCP